MGLFFYTQKGSIISMVDLPTTEIIEPKFLLNDILKKAEQWNLLFMKTYYFYFKSIY